MLLVMGWSRETPEKREGRDATLPDISQQFIARSISRIITPTPHLWEPQQEGQEDKGGPVRGGGARHVTQPEAQEAPDADADAPHINNN